MEAIKNLCEEFHCYLPVDSKRIVPVQAELIELVQIGVVAEELDMWCTGCFVHFGDVVVAVDAVVAVVAVVVTLTAVLSSYLYPLGHYFDCWKIVEAKWRIAEKHQFHKNIRLCNAK